MAEFENDYEDVEVVVGLDIGTTKVVAVVGHRDKQTGKVKILGYGKTESTGVVRGSVLNIDKTAMAVKRAVAAAEAMSNVKIGEAYVGIAGQNIECVREERSYVRSNPEEIITRREIEQLKQNDSRCIMAPGKVIVHIIPLTFTVDGMSDLKEDDVVGMTGSKLEVIYNVVTAEKSALKNILRSVRMAGIELSGFILEPLVSAEAVLNVNDKDAGVVLIDIGGGTTDLAIFLNGVLHHTAVIPLAGSIITQDIRQGCNILQKQAETLKVKFGSALVSACSDDKLVSIPSITGAGPNKEISLKLLASIIDARVAEIFGAVYQEVRSCGLNMEDFIGGAVLTGGGSKLRHIEKSCSYHVRMDGRIGYPREHVNPDTPEELIDPAYATALGLVIYGVRYSEEERGVHIADIVDVRPYSSGQDTVYASPAAAPSDAVTGARISDATRQVENHPSHPEGEMAEEKGKDSQEQDKNGKGSDKDKKKGNGKSGWRWPFSGGFNPRDTFKSILTSNFGEED